MAEHPSIAAALRSAAAEAAGIEPNPDDVYLATYGTPRPNLAQTVGYEPQISYDDYMRRINSANLPAVRASGAHFSPNGAREGYEDFGLPPVIQQRSPYATAAYRTFVDPWGQMMVQPLVGFPSAYPHVLSGVPTDFGNRVGYAMSLLGPIPQYMPPMPQAAAAPRAAAPKAAAPRNTQPKQTTTQPAAPAKPVVQKDYPPEWEWYHGNGETTPLPLAPQVQPQVQQPQAIDYPWLHYQDPWPEIFPQKQQAAPAPAAPPVQLQPPVQAPAQAAPAPMNVPEVRAPVSGVTVNPDGSWSEPPLEYNSPKPAPDMIPIAMTPSALLRYYG